MNNVLIEKLLIQAPCPTAPPGLLKQLRAEIALPQRAPTRRNGNLWQPWLRRWMPALAFGMLFVSCLVLIGVQSNYLDQLKRESATLLAAASAPIEPSVEASAQRAELEQLRKDYADLLRLRSIVKELRDLPETNQRLRAENERLLVAALAAGTASPDDRFFDEAQKRAERIACINNLKQFGLAVRVWALDQEGRAPSSVIEMSNELSTVTVLICPSDKAKLSYRSLGWTQFRPEMSSYQFHLSGEKDFGATQPADPAFPDSIIAKCPFHHNYALADGSVQSINPAVFQEVQIGGRWYLKRINDSPASQP